ncbi:MAG: hypothetical protein ACI83O_000964, partial [Patescibacteria group bacterium]
MVKVHLYIFLSLILLTAGFSQAQTDNQELITIKGKLLDQVTNEPVAGAELNSGEPTIPEKIFTNKEGEFLFYIDKKFVEENDPNKSQYAARASWGFYADCYGWSDSTILKRNHQEFIERESQGSFELALIKEKFDARTEVEEVSGKEIIDVGNVYIHPSADIMTLTENKSTMFVQYKYKNREGYNGPGQIGHTYDHNLLNALPLGYDVFIQFEDVEGRRSQSSIYKVPLDAKCKVVELAQASNLSDWSVKPRYQEGPHDENSEAQISEKT